MTKCSQALKIAALALAVPILALPASISIGGICEVNCTAAANPSLTDGQSVSGSVDVAFSIGGDNYLLTGGYGASYSSANGSTILFTPTLAYTGSAPSKTADSIVVDLFQNYYDSSPGNYDGTYTETIPLTVGANATASAELFYGSGSPTTNRQGLGLVGPYGPGSYSVVKTAVLTGLDDPTLSADYQFTFDFAAGTPPGSGSTSPSTVPEPSQTVPAAIGLGGLALLATRRRTKRQ
jgi:hypothetical protein